MFSEQMFCSKLLGYSRCSINVYGVSPFCTSETCLEQQFWGWVWGGPHNKETCSQMGLDWNRAFRSPHAHSFCKGLEKAFQKGICLVENSSHPSILCFSFNFYAAAFHLCGLGPAINEKAQRGHLYLSQK